MTVLQLIIFSLSILLTIAFAFWPVPIMLCATGIWLAVQQHTPHLSKKQQLALAAMRTWYVRLVLALLAFALAYIAVAFVRLNQTHRWQLAHNQELMESGQYAECGWLGLVPRNWTCEDRWQGDDRHLIAYNAAEPSQFVELSIGPPFMYRPCMPLAPIDFPILTRHAAANMGIPYLCVAPGLTYRASYFQEGTFTLVGNGISPQLFSDIFANISNRSQRHIFTSYDGVTIVPSQLSLSETTTTPIAKLYLSGTNLCRADNLGNASLHEQIIVRIADPNANPLDVAIADAQNCMLELRVPLSQLQPGSHTIYTTVNGLTRVLGTPLLVTE